MIAKNDTAIKTLSALVARANLAWRMGFQYGGDRNVYEALGYPTSIDYADRVARYTRQDIARAVIDKPVEASWNGGVLIQEATDEDTPLEKAWEQLIQKRELSLLPKLRRFDKLIGLGEYAILLYGFSDVTRREDFEKPVVSGAKLNLLYVRPVGEGNAPIVQWEKNSSSPRFGMPLMYQLTFSNDEGSSYDIRVHHSRILHVADGVTEGTVKGTSRLDPIWNRLMDLEKLVGGSAEMFWRGARPGYRGKLDDEYTMSTDEEENLERQINEYEHNLRRFLISKGIDLEALQSQVVDPTNHVDVQMQMISAQTGIPKRILTGSERGELASTQDQDAWNSLIEARRENFVGPEIVRPFIDTCIQYGILPPIKNTEEGYSLVWQSMFEQSDKDKAEVGRIRATALKEYASQPTAEMIVPPDAFYRYFLGFGEDEIALITEIQEATEKEIGEELGEETEE